MVPFRRPERRDPPPILTLLDLFEKHRPAFRYDWRARFGCRFDVPGEMSWGEAWDLTMELIGDPSSHVAASVAGWQFPVTREWIAAVDAYDVLVAVNSKSPKPYPRPWDKAAHALGAGTSMTVEQYRALRASLITETAV